jgi:hypothetical protein
MKRLISQILSLGGAAALMLATPFAAVAQFGVGNLDMTEALENAEGADPAFFIGNNYDFYPMLLDNVAGFDSLLAVSSLQDTDGSIQICVVPAGTSQLQCTSGILLPGRATRFFNVGSVGALGLLQNTTGQVYIFAGPNTVGASIAFILQQNGQGLTAVSPFQG